MCKFRNLEEIWNIWKKICKNKWQPWYTKYYELNNFDNVKFKTKSFYQNLKK